MIIQHDNDNANQALTIDQADPNILVVADFPFLDQQCAGGQIDLTPFQGGPARIYLEADGSLNTELFRDHFWLLAEVILPERQFTSQPTGQVDENNQAITQMIEIPLDLNKASVMAYPLPEVTQL